MKKFRVTWKYEQTGTSYVEAEDLEDAKDKAPGSVTDFGDPEQFITDVTWDTGWELDSIEEVI